MKIVEKLAKKNDDIFGAEPVTVVFFGDSVTHGCFECFIDEKGNVDTVFERNNSYAVKTGNILSALYPRAQINIINSGLSGGSAKTGLARIERDVLKYNPDLVVVNFALNDCMAGVGFAEEYGREMEEIFFRIKEIGAEAILLTPNSMCGYASKKINEPALKNIAEAAAKIMKENVLAAFVDRAKSAAEKYGVAVCDAFSLWQSMSAGGVNTTELLANYINHPTRDMQTLFAYKIVETMFTK